MRTLIWLVCCIAVVAGGCILAFGIGLSNIYWFIAGSACAGLGFYIKRTHLN